MAKTPPKISDAEWEVMEVVWTDAPLTSSQIVDLLAPKFRWSPRTVKTMLNRLVRKGALAFEADGNRYIYRPAVSRQSCVRVEGQSFLRRVFGGDVGPMLAHFVEDSKLTPQQLEELRKLLEKKQK